MFGSDKKENVEISRLWAAIKSLEGQVATQGQGLTDLQAKIASLTTIATDVATAIQDLKGQITQLQGQVAAGAEVTDAQLETMAQTIQAAEDVISQAVAPPAPAPTTGS